MAREPLVTLTPRYRKRKYKLSKSPPTQDLDASNRADEDIEGELNRLCRIGRVLKFL